jgi:hypothetical protein
METKFTPVNVPERRGRKRTPQDAVTVAAYGMTLGIGASYTGKRATVESDGNGALRIVIADHGRHLLRAIEADGNPRMECANLIKYLGLKPGQYQGRMEGNALYLNLNEMVQS